MSESTLSITPPNAEIRQWAMFCHLSARLGLVVRPHPVQLQFF